MREALLTCKICGETKPAIKGIWVTSFGKPSGRRCLKCSSKRTLAYHYTQMSNNHEEYRARQLGYQKAYQRAYYHKMKTNEDFILAKRARNSKHQKLNLGEARAIKARRRAAKLQRTPRWLTQDDFSVMKDIYMLSVIYSQVLGIQYHVDHEIPLQGKFVSGLHVPKNLQVLSAAGNLSKGIDYEV